MTESSPKKNSVPKVDQVVPVDRADPVAGRVDLGVDQAAPVVDPVDREVSVVAPVVADRVVPVDRAQARGVRGRPVARRELLPKNDA